MRTKSFLFFLFLHPNEPQYYGDSNQIGDSCPVGHCNEVNQNKQPNDWYGDHMPG